MLENRWETNNFNKTEQDEWIENLVGRERTAAGKPVEDTETAIQQEQDNISFAEVMRFRARRSEKTFKEMLKAS